MTHSKDAFPHALRTLSAFSGGPRLKKRTKQNVSGQWLEREVLAASEAALGGGLRAQPVVGSVRCLRSTSLTRAMSSSGTSTNKHKHITNDFGLFFGQHSRRDFGIDWNPNSCWKPSFETLTRVSSQNPGFKPYSKKKTTLSFNPILGSKSKLLFTILILASNPTLKQ